MSLKIIGLVISFIAVATFFYSYNERFMEWLRIQSIGTRDYIVERLNTMFIQTDPNHVLFALFGLSFGLGSLVAASFLPQVVPAIIFGGAVAVAGWKLPRPLVNWYYKRRCAKFVIQMVDALNLMSNGMKSGLSVAQAVGLVVQEMPNPVQQEFNLVLSENKLGIPLEEALNNLAKRVQADDVEMFVTAINILKETGGNLAETFDTISTTIRERIKVEKKIEVLTASSFYQGMVVLAMPPVMGLIFYTSDPEFMRPLFSTSIGWLFVTGVFTLELVAFFVIMKLVKIDV